MKVLCKICEFSKKPTVLYIGVNIFVSFLGFVRSFLFMRWLDLPDLGLISLIQTVMQFIGLFQFGLINGGYRMFALNKAEDNIRVNNTLFTFFAILFGLLIIVWLILIGFDKSVIVSNSMLLVAIITGMFQLVNNWINNTLIGTQKYASLNIYNLISGFVSVLLILSIHNWGIIGALSSIAIQPLLFVSLALFNNKDLRPTGLLIDIKLIRYILSFGFIPFIAGIFTILNLQIERWSIANFLGVEDLGRFYLVFLYNSIYVLVPTSILNIFFPRAVKSYDEGNFNEFKCIIGKQLTIEILYVLVVLILTFVFIEPVVGILFPKHIDNVQYVYYFLPGVIAISLTDVSGLILNSSVRLRPILYGGMSALFIYMLVIPILVYLNVLSLSTMAILKSMSYVCPLLIYVIYIVIHWNKIKKGYDD